MHVALTLEGIEVAHGSGFPEEAPRTLSNPFNAAEYEYVRIRGKQRSWAITMPSASGFGVRDGAKVQARFSYRFQGFSPIHETLSLRAATGGNAQPVRRIVRQWPVLRALRHRRLRRSDARPGGDREARDPDA